MSKNSFDPPNFLTWRIIRFILEAETPAVLPAYKGSTFHGALDRAFYHMVCAVRGKKCEECLLNSDCLYVRLFQPSYPKSHPHALKFKTAPRPYVLKPPLTVKCDFSKSDHLEFELVLLGPAMDVLPYYVYAVTEMGKRGLGKKRGKFNLLRVEEIIGGEPAIIFESGAGMLSVAPDRFIPATAMTHENLNFIRLQFLTPLRIVKNKHLVTRLTFPVLFENLAHRLTLLTEMYGRRENLPDFSKLAQHAKDIHVAESKLRWHDWKRYSGNQDAYMKFGGLAGAIAFEGDLTPFIPYLALGSQVHIGQKTTFGLGHYKIIE
jgi:hypothetical protein